MTKINSFYKGKTVLITGHTGFKGSWLSYMLYMMGAQVIGISLKPNTTPSIFEILKLEEKIESHIIDIRDYEEVYEVFKSTNPEIVIHLAAQPLVIDSYKDPRYTYGTNVMGTVNICECVRNCKSVKSFINVTTDKVYKNKEWIYGYRENEELNGFDPYSNSKSCSELVTSSYINSFFNELDVAVSTCRAGNVIGGGDFSENRIVPDCVKYTIQNQEISVRNPNSTRPYQHVLEAVTFYAFLAMKQYENKEAMGSYNIGPNDTDCVTTGQLVTTFCKLWGEPSKWAAIDYHGPHEANFLKLDTSLIKSKFGWNPVWNVTSALKKTIEWSKCFYAKDDIEAETSKEINEYIEMFNEVVGY